ncbi:hypothetical protein Q3A80_12040 [Burkholderia sp. SR8]|jgi:hypothetical protein|uniref:hypothetical protein n=1 Tax=Burkholderia sp. SR8 TaxID=3062277 RepID=UPI0040631153
MAAGNVPGRTHHPRRRASTARIPQRAILAAAAGQRAFQARSFACTTTAIPAAPDLFIPDESGLRHRSIGTPSHDGSKKIARAPEEARAKPSPYEDRRRGHRDPRTARIVIGCAGARCAGI